MNQVVLLCLVLLSSSLVAVKAIDCTSRCQSDDFCMFSCTLLKVWRRQDFSDPATCYSSCKGDITCEDICRITLETGK